MHMLFSRLRIADVKPKYYETTLETVFVPKSERDRWFLLICLTPDVEVFDWPSIRAIIHPDLSIRRRECKAVNDGRRPISSD
jgi:hypothetical protein